MWLPLTDTLKSLSLADNNTQEVWQQPIRGYRGDAIFFLVIGCSALAELTPQLLRGSLIRKYVLVISSIFMCCLYFVTKCSSDK